MKNILSTKKGKIISGSVTGAVVAGIIAVFFLMNRGYRTISVEALNGLTSIVNDNKTTEAYVGLHLKSGDDVTVSQTGDLTLAMDEDKHVYAEPGTHFFVEAAGTLASTRTNVRMDKGSNLFRIDDPLEEDEFFNVDTPNSTMSVRGTVFRVTCSEDSGIFYTKIEVFEGEVYVEALYENGSSTEKSRLLHAGESATIWSDPENADFVVSEAGTDVCEIEYKSIPRATAEFLGRTIDDGRVLSITKELLYDYVEINPHVFDELENYVVDYVDATCVEEGHYFYICRVCGEVKSEEYKIPVKTGEHVYVEEESPHQWCHESYVIIKKCKDCDEIIERTEYPAREHVFDKGTLVEDPEDEHYGYYLFKCNTCGWIEYIKKEEADALTDSDSNSRNAKGNGRNQYGYTEEEMQMLLLQQLAILQAQAAAKNPVSQPEWQASTDSASPDPYSNPKGSGSDPRTPANTCTHRYVVTDTTAATCTAPGNTEETCSLCNDVKNTPIAVLGHSYAFDAPGAATGSHVVKCQRAGCTDTQNEACSGNSMTQYKDYGVNEWRHNFECDICHVNYRWEACTLVPISTGNRCSVCNGTCVE